VASRLPFQLAPYTDELLSAFLVRSAHAHGINAHRFCRVYLPPAITVWTRDIDCTARLELLQEVSNAWGFDIGRAYEMILQTPPPISVNASVAEREACFSQWVNAVGVYHRSRTRFGLQYCPQCLSDRPTYVRAWRYSFVTVCPVHYCALLDRCRSCGSPVVPHRSFLLTRCHHCGAFLSGSRARLPYIEFEKKLAIQDFFTRAMYGESMEIGTLVVPASDFLAGALAILGNIKEKLYSYPALIPLPVDFVARTPPLRLASCADRARWMIVLASVLEEWPSRFLALADSCAMSQVGFSRYRVPGWLGSVIAQLPSRTRSRCGWSRGTLNARIRRIEEAGGHGCRAERATVLFDAAQDRR